MPARLLFGFVAVLAAWSCTASAPSSSAVGGPTQVKVLEPADVNASSFVPTDVTVPKGATVEWFNNGKSFHTVTSNDPGRPFDIGLDPGQRATVTFVVAGDFAYHCGVHPAMKGAVHVCDGQCA